MATYREKKFWREEFLQTCGRNKNDAAVNLRICSGHDKNTKTFKKDYKIFLQDGTTRVIKDHKIIVPHPKTDGMKSKNHKNKNDSRCTESLRRHIIEMETLKEQSKLNSLVGEVAKEKMERYRVVEGNSATSEIEKNNKHLLNATGLEVHKIANKTGSKMYRIKIGGTKVREYKKVRWTPTQSPKSITDREVKVKTGYKDSFYLLCFIIIVCNGDFDLVSETVSYLTWFQEWFLVFEYFRGSTIRTIDSICSVYDMHYHGVLKIIWTKIQLCLNCRANWPTYLFMDED